jgi:preprotein translocase subunit SecG
MSEEARDFLVILGAIMAVVMLVSCVVLAATYTRTEQRLRCVDMNKARPAAEIVVVCGRT